MTGESPKPGPWAVSRMRMLGKRVQVTLDDASGHAKVIVTGRLISFSLDGAFVIEADEDGMVHYCWPMLDCAELPA